MFHSIFGNAGIPHGFCFLWNPGLLWLHVVSDSLIALDTKTKKWTYFRVPYPLGYYSRGMDARIDDPDLGWKGRALYSNYGTHFVWHIEGGKGTKGKIVKFQIRPDPLAR